MPLSRIGAADLNPAHGLLWVLMLAFPFPYIANTLGWMTAELGRQPWLVYGLFRTRDGYSKVVSNGDTIFTLIGFPACISCSACCFFTWWAGRSRTARTTDPAGSAGHRAPQRGAGTPYDCVGTPS